MEPNKQAVYSKKYRDENKEALKKKRQEYNKKNKEEVSFKRRSYYLKNKKKLQAQNKATYYARAAKRHVKRIVRELRKKEGKGSPSRCLLPRGRGNG